MKSTVPDPSTPREVAEDTLFPVPPKAPTVDLSAGQRLTIRNNELIAAGVHPATHRPIADGEWTCGECDRHKVIEYHTRTYHKCDRHRLGLSSSASSDIRVGWPACTWFLRNGADLGDIALEI